MPRSVDLTADSPASVEQFQSAFGNEHYWRDGLAVNDAGAAVLDLLDVGADGGVTVVMTLSPLRDRLPGPVAQLHRGHLQIRHTETWRPVGDGRVRGQIDFTVSGAPLSGGGAVWLTPVPDGSRLTCTATVTVRVPLIGGAIERFLGGQLPDGIRAAQRLTTEWIVEHF